MLARRDLRLELGIGLGEPRPPRLLGFLVSFLHAQLAELELAQLLGGGGIGLEGRLGIEPGVERGPGLDPPLDLRDRCLGELSISPLRHPRGLVAVDPQVEMALLRLPRNDDLVFGRPRHQFLEARQVELAPTELGSTSPVVAAHCNCRPGSARRPSRNSARRYPAGPGSRWPWRRPSGLHPSRADALPCGPISRARHAADGPCPDRASHHRDPGPGDPPPPAHIAPGSRRIRWGRSVPTDRRHRRAGRPIVEGQAA